MMHDLIPQTLIVDEAMGSCVTCDIFNPSLNVTFFQQLLLIAAKSFLCIINFNQAQINDTFNTDILEPITNAISCTKLIEDARYLQ